MSLFFCIHKHSFLFFFFFNDTATTEIYTLSLHDALPIFYLYFFCPYFYFYFCFYFNRNSFDTHINACHYVYSVSHILRSEEHTSELQSQSNLVCRLLLEKKKNKSDTILYDHIATVLSSIT